MADPKYIEIAEDLRRRIRSSEFAQGTQLPTEGHLCDEYEASRNTIRLAVDRLTREGLVAKRQGQGTFVTIKVDPFVTVLSTRTPGIDGGGLEGATYLSQVTAQHRRASASKPKVEIQECQTEVAVGLGITPGDDVISRHQKRYIDDMPWTLQTSFYPYELSTKADRLLKAADIEEGTVKYLAETWGLDQVGYRDWVRVRPPDSEEQQFFRLGPDALIFELYRIAFARTVPAPKKFIRTGVPEGFVPTRVTMTVYPADRNLLVSNYGEVPELYEVETNRPEPEQQQPG
ncbi:MAG: GntR family transcriptional regulator [Trebonia sp.]